MHIFDDFVIVLLFGRSFIIDYLCNNFVFVTVSSSSSLLLIYPLRELLRKFSHRLVQNCGLLGAEGKSKSNGLFLIAAFSAVH